MIALDTQILVYSVREESPWHLAAIACVRRLAEGTEPWAIPWPCVHEFVSVVTHPRIYRPPTSLGEALQQVTNWMESPSLSVIGETRDHWDVYSQLSRQGHAVGPLAHDARVAAICKANGVRELWSLDRDFTRFSDLKVLNPLT